MEKHKKRKELLEKYFKEESNEVIKSHWDKLNGLEFGELTIGEFLDFHSNSNDIIQVEEKYSQIHFCDHLIDDGCSEDHLNASIENKYFPFSTTLLESKVNEFVSNIAFNNLFFETLIESKSSTENEFIAGNSKFAMAA